jgi:hypothetical protein
VSVQGQHEEALDDFEECTKLQPNEASYHHLHGGALRTLSRLSEAVTVRIPALLPPWCRTACREGHSFWGESFPERAAVYLASCMCPGS